MRIGLPGGAASVDQVVRQARDGSVFDAVGGSEAFLRLAGALHARCLADPDLNHPFSHGIDLDHWRQ